MPFSPVLPAVSLISSQERNKRKKRFSGKQKKSQQMGKEEEKGPEKIKQKDKMKWEKGTKLDAAAHSRCWRSCPISLPMDSRDDEIE